jgi:hypothetical protein
LSRADGDHHLTTFSAVCCRFHQPRMTMVEGLETSENDAAFHDLVHLK